MNRKRINIYTKDTEAISNALYMLDIFEFQIVNSIDEIKAELDKVSKYWDFIDEEKLKEEIGEERIVIYTPDDSDELFNIVKNGLKNNAAVNRITCDEFEDEDWIESWKKFFAEISVSEGLSVIPCWQEETPKGKKAIKINPGMIFGTGSHETTRLCLKAIEHLVKDGDRFLDLGCGSGILAIGALMLGAKSALCVDLEENAKTVVLENAGLNGIKDGIEVLTGDLIEDEALKSRIASEKYDFIAANIVAGVIIAILPLVKACLKQDGTFVCSGIIDDKKKSVKAALVKSGFKIIDEEEEDKWTAFTCTL
ncbi:MAG: 50S ribosomal protein L11 methyltransferase [Clostridia bacterium]|nr:50S ribosomal protein L11 methyltransferase [Clostridia bacterium]